MLHYSKSILVLIALFVGSTLFAQRRSIEEATAIAEQFLRQNVTTAQANTPQMRVVSKKQLTRRMRVQRAGMPQSATMDAFYIVNDENNNRFVIVSADERMKTILGYSDSGCFDPEVMPAGLMDMLYSYQQEWDALNSLPQAFSSQQSVSQTTPVSSVAISPLIQTQWGQSAPFNDDCPTYEIQDETSITTHATASGCVATAMAQIINYWKYPINGKGQYSYITATHSIPQSFDFETLNMNYDNLTDGYSYKNSDYEWFSTDIERAEVAKLMHACGVSVNMDYGESSSAGGTDIAYALINHFDYNPNITTKYRMFYSDDEWNEMILDELKNKRPILYSGAASNYGGHSFILDGCDKNGLYHFNFGWTLDNSGLNIGIGNGYFSIDAISPTLSFFTYNFVSSHAMISNITPELTGTHEDNVVAGTFYLPDTTIAQGATVPFEFDALCMASSTTYYGHPEAIFKGIIGVGLFDEQRNLLKSLYDTIYESKTTIHSEEGLHIGTFSIDTTGLRQDEQYYIMPFVQGNNSTLPTLIRTYQAQTDYYIFLYDSDSSYIYSKEDRSLTIVNDAAGELSGKIAVKQLPILTHLSISGPLNGIDIVFLQDILANNKITYLDLSGCSIIGGTEGMKTSDNCIKDGMFSNSKYLTTLILPKSVERIWDAIHNCTNLERVILPDQLKEFSIGKRVFSRCPKLKELSISSENSRFTTIGGILYTQGIDTLVKYPSGLLADSYTTPTTVNAIYSYAISETLLKKIVFADAVKTISGRGCLTNLLLEEIEIPASIEYVGPWCFYECYNLSHIICHVRNNASIERLRPAFATSSISSNCLWSVPRGTADIYKSQSWWVSTWRIEETLENTDHPGQEESITFTDNDHAEVRYNNGVLSFSASQDSYLQVYSTDGTLIYSCKSLSSESINIQLPAGIYIINGKKYVLK